MRPPRVLMIAAIVLLAAPSYAQSVRLFDIDTSAFPKMKAKLYAFDANGRQQFPTAASVTITENGVARDITSISCPEAAPPKTLSSVLVIDVSGSMADGEAGTPNIDLAKAAATEWTKSVGIGQNECAIVSFDGDNYFDQDYTNNRQKLLSVISTLHPNGGTDYNMALVNPTAGGLQVTKDGKHQRVIVMLTDGLPNFEPQTSAIIADAQKQNCLIYVVTVGLPCPQCLKDISEATGGKWFENVVTQKQITDVYNEILRLASSGLPPCEIEWTSGPVCSANPVKVVASWGGVSDTASFMPQPSAIARLSFEPYSLIYINRAVGQKYDTTITVTAVNSDFNVSDINVDNAAFDVSPKSFSLSAGQSRSLTVSFTPFDSSYTWTHFNFRTDVCDQDYYVRALYPGKPTRSTLRLIQPNGGERFLSCSDTVIRWTGIAPSDTVQLEFSVDSGKTWITITDSATGGEFKWHVPNGEDSNYLVRVTQLTNSTVFDSSGWSREPMCSHWAAGDVVAVDPSGCVYLAGVFYGSVDFGEGVSVVDSGPRNIYLVKYDPDGHPIWAKSITSGPPFGNYPSFTYGNSVRLSADSNGNVYLCSGVFGDMRFGGVILHGTDNGPTLQENQSFIAKYKGDGTLLWVKATGLEHTAVINAIASDRLENTYIAAICGYQMLWGSDTLKRFDSTLEATVFKVDKDGHPVWVQHYPGAGVSSIAVRDSMIYTIGNGNYDTLILNNVGHFINGYYLIAQDTSGVFLWADFDSCHPFQPNYDLSSQGNALSADNNGNIWITGSFLHSTYYPGRMSLGDRVLYGDSGNRFFAFFNSVGKLLFVDQFAGEWGYGTGIAATSDRTAFLTTVFNSPFHLMSLRIDRSEKDSAQQSACVAQSNGDGRLRWAKVIHEPSSVYRSNVACDNQRNVYISGTAAPYGSAFLSFPFLWKRSDRELQSDISDQVFLIVTPQIASTNIDIGNIPVRHARDSVIQDFIRNSGSLAFRVDSILIVGRDSADFGIVSGIPPFEVPADSARKVEFVFRPTTPGEKQAQIVIYSGCDTLVQTISGYALPDDLPLVASIVDFGKTRIGSYHDTTIALTNNGSSSITFTGTSQLGPDTRQFVLEEGNGPFTLAAGASHDITVRYQPRTIGRRSGRISFDRSGAAPAVFTVFGKGLGGVVALCDDSARAGQTVHVPVTLESISAASVPQEVKNIRMSVAYDADVLAPKNGTVTHGTEYDTVSLQTPFMRDSILTTLPFTVTASSHTTSPIGIVNFSWLDAEGKPVDFDVEASNAVFKLLSGSDTMIAPRKTTKITVLIGSASDQTITVRVEGTAAEEQGEIELYNVLGQKIATVYNGGLSALHEFAVSSTSLAVGVYFITLRTPSEHSVQHFTYFR